MRKFKQVQILKFSVLVEVTMEIPEECLAYVMSYIDMSHINIKMGHFPWMANKNLNKIMMTTPRILEKLFISRYGSLQNALLQLLNRSPPNFDAANKILDIEGKHNLGFEDNMLLRLACTEGNIDLLTYLLAHPMLPRIDNNTYVNMIIDVCQFGCNKCVQLLLNQENSPRADYQDGEFLMHATFSGRLDVVKVILEHPTGPSPNCRGGYALSIAIMKKYTDIVKHFINLYDGPRAGEEYELYFLMACEVGNIDIIRVLVENERAPVRVDCHDGVGLLIAVQTGCTEIVEYLLTRDDSPDVDILDGSCLITACEYSFIEIVHTLLHHSKCPRRLCMYQNMMAFNFAIFNERNDIIQLMMMNSCINADFNDGILLIRATAYNKHAVVRYLLQHPTGPRVECNMAKAFLICIFKENIPMMILLCSHLKEPMTVFNILQMCLHSAHSFSNKLILESIHKVNHLMMSYRDDPNIDSVNMLLKAMYNMKSETNSALSRNIDR